MSRSLLLVSILHLVSLNLFSFCCLNCSACVVLWNTLELVRLQYRLHFEQVLDLRDHHDLHVERAPASSWSSCKAGGGVVGNIWGMFRWECLTILEPMMMMMIVVMVMTMMRMPPVDFPTQLTIISVSLCLYLSVPKRISKRNMKSGNSSFSWQWWMMMMWWWWRWCDDDDDDDNGDVDKTERECFGWECPEDLGSDDQLCQICSPRLGQVSLPRIIFSLTQGNLFSNRRQKYSLAAKQKYVHGD